MKIIVLDGYTLNPGDLSWNGLKSFGEFTVYDRTPEDKILERIKGADIVLTNKTPITRKTLEETKTVKYIGVLATGYDIVDVKAAKEMSIPVTNVPTYGTNAVSQYVFALLLEICHHVGAHDEAVKRGDWTNNSDWCFWNYPLIELADKTMGIIGFGRIGQRTSEIAVAMGMKVLAYDEYKNNALENENVKYVSLDELYAYSDVISLHCPLTEKTKDMINKNSIARMKDGVIIINAARGQLIIDSDLAEALNSGKVYAAGLDVVSREPIQMNNPLLKAKNVIITPHMAWGPKESRLRLMNVVIDNIKAFLDNKPINVVNR